MGADLPDTLLLAVLTSHYSHLERRLETAVRPSDAKVQHQIANAAVSFLQRTCEQEVAARIEGRREELVTALIAQRTVLNECLFDLAQHLERPVFVGPVNLIFNPLRRLNVVMTADATRSSGRYALSTKEHLLVESQFRDSTGLTWGDLEGRNAMLYATPDVSVMGQLLDEAGWQVTPTHVALGDLRVEGDNLALIACRARPGDATLGDVVYASAEDRVLVGINGLHHGPSDFVIGRLTAEGHEVIMRGNFARTEEGYLSTTPRRR